LETLLVERSDGVVTVTMNRPKKKNAMDPVMSRELLAVLDEVTDNRDDRVLVLTGAGDGFCTGADLTADLTDASGGVGSALHGMRRIGALALRLHQLARPTIAAVNGVAAGLGCNLAFGCDLIVAADTARFSEIFVRRGLTLDFGGTWLLPRLIGLHRAKELAFLGDIISAKEAADIGLVNRLVPAGELMETAHDLARRIAVQAPIPLSMMKLALNNSLSMSMAEALEYEAIAQTAVANSADTAEAMVAFVQKRDPTFHGE
jgi:2-(1,2-epoxy-1,2-dihydrophenyl)acetyl-CoA isomerase